MSNVQNPDNEEISVIRSSSKASDKQNLQESVDILEKLKEDPQLVHQIIAKIHNGPLPCPEDLKLYNQLISNGADRIMSMAEKEQSARIELEKRQMQSNLDYMYSTLKLQKFGQIYAFGTVILFCILSLILILLGSHKLGALLMGFSLVSIVVIFVKGRSEETGSK